MSKEAGWLDYWANEEFWSGQGLWRLNAEIFLKRAADVLKLRPDDEVLDIGSGPGELAVRLAPRVKSVLAADAAPAFVEQARIRGRGLANVQAAQTADDYTDLSGFGRRFSLFLCISVVQYYRDMAEVEKLIRSAQRIARPGARLLIADINLRRGRFGFLLDAAGSLCAAVRDGYWPALLRMAFRRWGSSSEYRRTYAAAPLLEFTLKELEALAARTGLKTEIIRRSFSIYANRPSLLIYF